jgi:SM-20-related protein
MTSKQILDSFSETLMQDERILSGRERALLAALLQHAKTASAENQQTQEAVRSVIASAVGETVAQRAFTVLGGSIVEHLVRGSSIHNESVRSTDVETMDVPVPPKPPGPQPPGTPVRIPPMTPPAPGPQPPGLPMSEPVVTPPSTGPQSPGHGVRTTVISQSGLAVADRPAALLARSVILDEFLAPEELEQLTRFTLEHEAQFRASEVISPNAEGGVVSYDHRRSMVLTEIGWAEEVILERIKSVLREVLAKLGMPEFPISKVEAQITASADGDFFHCHSDNGSDLVASRHLTFVYFFHREPRQFEGGELRIHDVTLKNGSYATEGSYQRIVPRQNQIVFFPCELLHEITPVKSSSQVFADSRFTLNGWLHQ